MVLALPGDPVAAEVLRRVGPSRSTLIEPRDLSRLGWHHDPLDPSRDRMVSRHGPFRVSEARTVLVRLGMVTPQDLAHVAAADREYVAAESTAFLLSLLAALRCPVVNRPTPRCLAGPAMSAEEWTRLARQAGLRVASAERSEAREAETTVPSTPTPRIERRWDRFVVLGRRVSPSVPEARAALAGRIADLAGARLLEVRLSPDASPRLFATPLPCRLEDSEVTDLVELLDLEVDS